MDLNVGSPTTNEINVPANIFFYQELILCQKIEIMIIKDHGRKYAHYNSN